MTESTAVGTYGFNTKKIRNSTSVGLLAPNMEAKVVDCKTGHCMPPGEKGELWLRGPAIMKGRTCITAKKLRIFAIFNQYEISTTSVMKKFTKCLLW